MENEKRIHWEEKRREGDRRCSRAQDVDTIFGRRKWENREAEAQPLTKFVITVATRKTGRDNNDRFFLLVLPKEL